MKKPIPISCAWDDQVVLDQVIRVQIILATIRDIPLIEQGVFFHVTNVPLGDSVYLGTRFAEQIGLKSQEELIAEVAAERAKGRGLSLPASAQKHLKYVPAICACSALDSRLKVQKLKNSKIQKLKKSKKKIEYPLGQKRNDRIFKKFEQGALDTRKGMKSTKKSKVPMKQAVHKQVKSIVTNFSNKLAAMMPKSA